MNSFEFGDSRIIEERISSQRVFDGLILHIDHDTNRLPDGSLAKREIARHIGAAAVIPVDEEGYVYLVRQFRSPFGRVLLEIPAGKLDVENEDRLLAAQRELREETGIHAEHWTKLNDLYTTVGFCDECISIYLATGLTRGSQHLDPDEFLNVVRIPFAEALRMAEKNMIHDSKTVIGLLLAEKYLIEENK